LPSLAILFNYGANAKMFMAIGAGSAGGGHHFQAVLGISWFLKQTSSASSLQVFDEIASGYNTQSEVSSHFEDPPHPFLCLRSRGLRTFLFVSKRNNLVGHFCKCYIVTNQKKLVVPVFRYFFTSHIDGPECMSQISTASGIEV
jgi:hypothetical protein